MEGYDYGTAAITVKIEDIVRGAANRKILIRLKENDSDLDKLRLTDEGYWRRDENDYRTEGDYDSGWLGYFIGKNTHLRELQFQANPFQGFNNNAIETFVRGVSNNRSIQEIHLDGFDLAGGEIFQPLRPFFADNNLSELSVFQCNFGAGSARQLSLALRGWSKSLKCIRLGGNRMGGEQSVEIIDALSAHPQLETLELTRMNVGRRENIMALVNLLRITATNLQELDLYNNNIDKAQPPTWSRSISDKTTLGTKGRVFLPIR